MKAVVLHEHGGPEVLKYEDAPDPSPGSGEIVVRVHAVSVNRTLDCVVHQGRYRIKPSLPHILGNDPAGIVAAVGEGVSELRVGDRVCTSGVMACGECPTCQAQQPSACATPRILGVSAWGGCAEYVGLPARNATVIPANVSFADASVINRHYSAAFHFVDRLAEMKAGEWVLVMGAAGALGSAIVQVAKLRGAMVIAAAGSDERAASGVENGAAYGINYRAQDLAAEVRRLTDGRGVEIVMENIGDPTLWKGAFDSLARGGRLVTGGAHGGGKVELDVNRLYGQQLRIIGGTSGPREFADRAWEAARAGHLHPIIGATLPLSDVVEAHHIAESQGVVGKVMLTVAS